MNSYRRLEGAIFSIQSVDKTLVKYGKDPAAKNQESLFGPEQLKNQVESVKTSQVVSLAHR